eukprot:TRINITY_DN7360_c0_g2_i1.p2 TRINITY_DN7360_c0_g2~~TRINITY_DN7360_c0_g2_i1.p2  ORF type:complete len:155 (-),score=10.18 TRINITY_DN7360_c0_g2_i1:219-683(-)
MSCQVPPPWRRTEANRLKTGSPRLLPPPLLPDLQVLEGFLGLEVVLQRLEPTGVCLMEIAMLGEHWTAYSSLFLLNLQGVSKREEEVNRSGRGAELALEVDLVLVVDLVDLEEQLVVEAEHFLFNVDELLLSSRRAPRLLRMSSSSISRRVPPR